jgi:hypothetical protein
MRLFGRKRTSVVGADGVEYVWARTEQIEDWVVPLCNQAVERLDEPVAGWMQLAHETNKITILS